MARSKYVYILRDPAAPSFVMAFTVKRELLAWCARYGTWTIRERLVVDRVRDGRSEDRVRLGTVTEVLGSEL